MQSHNHQAMQYKTDPPRLQAATDWPATRDEGLQRLSEFVDRAGSHYAAERNYDFGPEQRTNVSVLSPYIRHRLISEAEVAAEVIAAHGLSASEKFIQEVCWRTYWKGWLESRPAIWDRYVKDVVHLKSADAQNDLMQKVRVACAGETGIACFDAWARELVETGYLHNHARMWFASIWIFTLKLPWQLGADFFMTHLLDGDPASNTLSWRWMCGLHTRGKTYLARSSNISEFTRGRFPQTERLAPFAEALTDDGQLGNAQPIKPRKKLPSGDVVLLMTDEDLNPETLTFDDARVRSVVMLSGLEHGVTYAPRVQRFKAAARLDASARAARHFWCKSENLDCSDGHGAERLVQLSNGLPLVCAEIPIGQTRAAFEPMLDVLNAHGCAVHFVRREWDDAFWPHASRGFFQLKDKIPTVLRQLGMAG